MEYAIEVDTLPKEKLQLKCGDIFLTRGRSSISWAIRVAERTPGEEGSRVNHVGVVIDDSDIMDAEVVEALHRVRRHRLADAYGERTDLVAIYRPINLSLPELDLIVAFAESYVGRRYGYLKLVLHGLDWVLGGRYVFRRLGKMKNYPICSWLVAMAYARVGANFGVNPGAATPDDIWDFVTSNPDKFTQVRELKEIR